MDLRLYAFGNFYMSALQQGLQTAHVISDLFDKYSKPSASTKLLRVWARDHKTIIILNGGMADDLLRDYEAVSSVARSYPHALFREEKAALNESATCWGIVLPASVYEARPLDGISVVRPAFSSLAHDAWWEFDSPEALICRTLIGKPLAR